MARQITKPGLTTGQHATIDHTGIPGVGGGEPETFTQEVHDLENHAGLPGVPAAEGFTKLIHDAENHSGILGVGSNPGTLVSSDNTVGASSWRKIQIAGANAGLMTKLSIAATDGQATPAMDYDIEIYTDEAESAAAYIARGITSVLYEDLVPWEWFGEGTMYIKIINNAASAIVELDITLAYRR